MKIAFRTHDLGEKGIDGVICRTQQYGISAVQLVVYKFMDEVKQKPGSLTREMADGICNCPPSTQTVKR